MNINIHEFRHLRDVPQVSAARPHRHTSRFLVCIAQAVRNRGKHPEEFGEELHEATVHGDTPNNWPSRGFRGTLWARIFPLKKAGFFWFGFAPIQFRKPLTIIFRNWTGIFSWLAQRLNKSSSGDFCFGHFTRLGAAWGPPRHGATRRCCVSPPSWSVPTTPWWSTTPLRCPVYVIVGFGAHQPRVILVSKCFRWSAPICPVCCTIWMFGSQRQSIATTWLFWLSRCCVTHTHTHTHALHYIPQIFQTRP